MPLQRLSRSEYNGKLSMSNEFVNAKIYYYYYFIVIHLIICSIDIYTFNNNNNNNDYVLLQCPPCRAFTPQLVDTYQRIRERGHHFEVIFVSSDR